MPILPRKRTWLYAAACLLIGYWIVWHNGNTVWDWAALLAILPFGQGMYTELVLWIKELQAAREKKEG